MTDIEMKAQEKAFSFDVSDETLGLLQARRR